MPISVICAGCKSKLKAPDKAAGRQLPCPKCKAAITVPAATNPATAPKPKDDDGFWDDLGLPNTVPIPAKPLAAPRPDVSAQNPSLPDSSYFQPVTPRPPSQPVARPNQKRPAIAPPDPSRQTGMLRHLHWWLAIAMLPLAISIFMPDETPDELQQRVVESFLDTRESETADEMPANETSAEASSTAPATSGEETFDEYAIGDSEYASDDSSEYAGDGEALFRMLPGHKLKGAMLARDSYWHWLFAMLSAGGFLTLFVLLATNNSAKPLHLLGLGAFTATAGVLLLLGLQALAMSGVGRIRIRGIGGLIVLVFLMIGLSYRMALDPEMGLIPSFLGFTAGVGFCEEFVKALPLIIYFRINSKLNWRGAFLWGLASGCGFGIAEGIMYSQDMYNGIAGPMIYLVRFISCVALHATWTGAVGISIQQHQDLLQEDCDGEDWWMFLLVIVRLLAIPMVLHGLYDTLLKKDMELFALLTAFASFGYLAWLVGRLRGDDETASRAKFVAEFARQHQATRA